MQIQQKTTSHWPVALLSIALLTVTGLLPKGARAMLINWQATLDQTQEIPAPAIVPGAAGIASGTLDLNSLLLTWNISFTGLSGPATGMHFHGPAAAGANAGVQVNIGNISGLASPSIGQTVLSAPQANDLDNGLWYINVHTSLNAPGEIRGQVTPVNQISEPAILGLIISGVTGLMALRRRRRR